MPAPKWLNRVVIDAIHLDQIREHGGLSGMDNESVLVAALERPKRKWEEDDPKPDTAVKVTGPIKPDSATGQLAALKGR